MTDNNNQFEINQEAKSWANKMLTNNVNSAQQNQLAQWLEHDVQHKKAFFFYRQQLFKKQRFGRRLATASIALAASLMLFVLMPTSILQQKPAPQVYSYAQGSEQVLPDGSIVELNVNSVISVRFSDDIREVTLINGDAWFDVTSDKSRPFIVKHDTMQVTALGTSFAIKTHQYFQVQVTEHSVEVKDFAGSQTKVIYEHQGLRIDQSGWRLQTAKELKSALAWRDNFIIFDGTPLSQALAELSVYLGKDVELMAAIEEQQPVTGRFHTNNPKLALEMICEGLGLTQKQLSGKKIILL